MAFLSAVKVVEQVSTVAGKVTQIFVAYQLSDDTTTETRVMTHSFTDDELVQIIASGGPAVRRVTARILVKPYVKQAYAAWIADIAARPVVTQTDLSTVNDPPLLPADLS